MRQSTFSAAIADRPLRPFQVVVMIFGLALLVIDGIDLQSLSLVTPVILEEWGIDRASFGPALAASLFGMGFGSFFGGMLGDRIGRLRTLFIACLIFGASTMIAAHTNTVWEMTAVRVLGGLGFGAAYPNALALVSDWVSEKWRPHAVSFLSVGIPVGISISAAVMPLLLPEYGWRGAFIIFGLVSIVLGVLIVLVLREPPSFLLARGKRAAAQKSAARVIAADIELLPESLQEAGVPEGELNRGLPPPQPAAQHRHGDQLLRHDDAGLRHSQLDPRAADFGRLPARPGAAGELLAGHSVDRRRALGRAARRAPSDRAW